MPDTEKEAILKARIHVAPILNRLDTPNELATYYFDAITHSVIWDDEIPPPAERGAETFAGLRPVLRFRASLILGKPHDQWLDYWLAAQQLFPKWIGFLPTRRQPNPVLVRFLQKNIARAERELWSLLAGHSVVGTGDVGVGAGNDGTGTRAPGDETGT